MSATSTIPIVFTAASDPVTAGMVASLNRPGGNVTGMYSIANELGTKQLGLIRELVPAASKIALLVNLNTPGADILPKEVQAAVGSLGLSCGSAAKLTSTRSSPASRNSGPMRSSAIPTVSLRMQRSW
jgi:putative ABC transport system substrate-binding protein